MKRFGPVLASLAFVASCGGTKTTVHDLAVGDSATTMTVVDSAMSGDGAQPTPPDLSLAAPLDLSFPTKRVLYVGGDDTNTTTANIITFAIDDTTGALTQTSMIKPSSPNPSYLAFNPAQTFLFANSEQTSGMVSAYSINRTTGALTALNTVSSQGQGPAFLSVDPSGKYVLVANYTDGGIAVIPIGSDGKLGAATAMMNAGKNAHMMITDPSGKFVFVPCLGSDWVAQYTFDPSKGTLTANATPHLVVPTGTGPRHMTFGVGGKYAYLVGETASTISTLGFNATNGTLSIIESHTTLPPGFTATNTAAEVHINPAGTFVYVSNRGADDITRFAIDAATGKLTYVDATPSGGTEPRDFTIDPSGAFLYAGNQSGNNVTPFKIAADGSLSTTAKSIAYTMATFAGVVGLSP